MIILAIIKSARKYYRISLDYRILLLMAHPLMQYDSSFFHFEEQHLLLRKHTHISYLYQQIMFFFYHECSARCLFKNAGLSKYAFLSRLWYNFARQTPRHDGQHHRASLRKESKPLTPNEIKFLRKHIFSTSPPYYKKYTTCWWTRTNEAGPILI